MENIINVSLLTRENKNKSSVISSKLSRLTIGDIEGNYQFFQLCFLLLEMALDKINPNLELNAVCVKTSNGESFTHYLAPSNEMILSEDYNVDKQTLRMMIETISYIRDNNVNLLKLNPNTGVYDFFEQIHLNLNEGKEVRR